MPYSSNLARLDEMLETLTSLANDQECEWQVEDPRWFQYRVHEALALAAQYPERYPQLAYANRMFRIKVVGPRLVRAVKRQTLRNQPMPLPVGIRAPEPHAATIGVSPAAASDVIAQVKTSSKPVVHFPEIKLSDEEMEVLFQWCEQQEPRKMMLGNWQKGELTVADWDPDMVSLRWTPGA